LQGQNTAALQIKVSGQAILQKLKRKYVFIKKTDFIKCLIPQNK